MDFRKEINFDDMFITDYKQYRKLGGLLSREEFEESLNPIKKISFHKGYSQQGFYNFSKLNWILENSADDYKWSLHFQQYGLSSEMLDRYINSLN